MVSRQIIYEGRVQGVGFRWTVRRLATGFEVAGWVKNLTDGRVEMQATGEDAEVEAFVKAIEESELRAHIHHTDAREIALLKNARGFEIAG